MSNLAPTASTFGTYPYMTTISQGAPLVFRGVSDAAHADIVAGFTYYYSLNGGSYASSLSPEFYLPSYAAGTYSVSAYVVDKDDGTSGFTA